MNQNKNSKQKRTISKTFGKRSIEKLVHFQCGKCMGWWTIGDPKEQAMWYCPWCGHKQEFKEI